MPFAVVPFAGPGVGLLRRGQKLFGRLQFRFGRQVPRFPFVEQLRRRLVRQRCTISLGGAVAGRCGFRPELVEVLVAFELLGRDAPVALKPFEVLLDRGELRVDVAFPASLLFEKRDLATWIVERLQLRFDPPEIFLDSRKLIRLFFETRFLVGEPLPFIPDLRRALFQHGQLRDVFGGFA